MRIRILLLHFQIFLWYFLTCPLPFYLFCSLFMPDDLLRASPLSLWRWVILHLIKQFSKIIFCIFQEITFGGLAFLLYFQNDDPLPFFPRGVFGQTSVFLVIVVLVYVVSSFFSFQIWQNWSHWPYSQVIRMTGDDFSQISLCSTLVNIPTSQSNPKSQGGFLFTWFCFMRKLFPLLFAWPSQIPMGHSIV